MSYSLKGAVTRGLGIAASGVFSLSLQAQTKSTTLPPVPRIEPGLEIAVTWKWKVVPSEGQGWGFTAPAPPAAPEAAAPSATPGAPPAPGAPAATGSPAEPRPSEHVVKSGDKLILIGKKYGLTAQQLKAFNGLDTDTIRIGQVLKIPTHEEVRSLPPPTVVEENPKPKAKPKQGEPEAAPPPKAEPVIQPQGQEDLLLQVFLDREGFGTGPIDGNPGTMFAAVSQLYRESQELQDMVAFREKARTSVGDPLTTYVLREEDMRFIAPDDDDGKKGGKKKSRSEEPPAPTYDELVEASFLAYRSAWEFVAEKFHCSESFLRKLNPRIRGNPEPGAIFQVPHVIPFEIEKAFEGPLQPDADPQNIVTAAIVGLTRLEITRNGKLVAVMPLALARPDLRGRGSWTILDAVPRPRLATLKEPKDQPAAPAPAAAAATPGSAPVAPAAPAAPVPPPQPAPTTEQYLAPGPNNPVGIVWINLAKAKSTEPLPYGLHGTSIPGRMQIQEGLGGLRLTNWDIIRALRLLPKGSALQWKL